MGERLIYLQNSEESKWIIYIIQEIFRTKFNLLPHLLAHLSYAQDEL